MISSVFNFQGLGWDYSDYNIILVIFNQDLLRFFLSTITLIRAPKIEQQLNRLLPPAARLFARQYRR